ncbi:MAG: hypothetical protein ACRENF_05985 [Thermodesulfobacteriota bacterium]
MPKKVLECKELGEKLGLDLGTKRFTGFNVGEVLMKTTQYIMWPSKDKKDTVEKVTPEIKELIKSLTRDLPE